MFIVVIMYAFIERSGLMLDFMSTLISILELHTKTTDRQELDFSPYATHT